MAGPARSRSAKDVFLMAGKEIYKNYQLFFGNWEIMPIFVPGLRLQPNRPGGFRGPKTKRVMTTIETANRTKTTYFVEYLCDDINNTYWQLVRSRDAAILAAHKDLNDIYAHCFICGINKQDVTIW